MPSQHSGADLPVMDEHDRLVKIVFVGDSAVGKTCLIRRLCDNEYSPSRQATIGVDFAIRKRDVDGKTWKLQIWDTGGQEKFRSITTTYYRHASAVVLCFDLSRRETFDSLGRWIEDVRCYAGSNASIVLVGTKSDLAGQVHHTTARQYGRSHGLPFVSTSAKTGENVERIMDEIASGVKSRLAELPAATTRDGNDEAGGQVQIFDAPNQN